MVFHLKKHYLNVLKYIVFQDNEEKPVRINYVLYTTYKNIIDLLLQMFQFEQVS